MPVDERPEWIIPMPIPNPSGTDGGSSGGIGSRSDKNTTSNLGDSQALTIVLNKAEDSDGKFNIKIKY